MVASLDCESCRFAASEDLDCESCQFEASKEKSTAEISTLSKSSESKVQTKYGIEDLFSSPPSVVAQSFPQQTPKDAKNGIINVFEKVKLPIFLFFFTAEITLD